VKLMQTHLLELWCWLKWKLRASAVGKYILHTGHGNCWNTSTTKANCQSIPTLTDRHITITYRTNRQW